jgi:magnesium-transporting ATPase (P-type)
MRDSRAQHNYLGVLDSLPIDLTTFFTYVVLLNSFIPLSLIVTLELAIFMQAIFMQWDSEMNTEGKVYIYMYMYIVCVCVCVCVCVRACVCVCVCV